MFILPGRPEHRHPAIAGAAIFRAWMV